MIRVYFPHHRFYYPSPDTRRLDTRFLLIPQDKVTLRIGVHHLQGKIASLPKPLGILTKRKLANSSTEYEITEIVTKKIIFSKRCVVLSSLVHIRIRMIYVFIYLIGGRPTPIVGHAGPVLNQS